MRFIFVLFFLVSGSLLAAEPMRVHWPLMDYVGLVKANAADQVQHSGGQAGLSFPMLLVFSPSGELKWLGRPDGFVADQIDLAASPAAGTENELHKVMVTLDAARRNIPDPGFDQVTGNPSEHLEAGRATAILVVGNFSCEGCVPMMEKSFASVPEDWNRVAAAVTLSR